MFMFGRLGGLLVGGVVESSWQLACRWSRLGGLLVGGAVESSWRLACRWSRRVVLAACL